MSRLISLKCVSMWARSHALPAVFSRDVLLSLCSCALDVGLFAAGVAAGIGMVPATFLARACSAVFNFLGCRHVVFRASSQGRLVRQAVAYLPLAVALSAASAFLVDVLYAHTGLRPILCKLLTDGFLFGVAFLAKRFVVFRSGRRETRPSVAGAGHR